MLYQHHFPRTEYDLRNGQGADDIVSHGRARVADDMRFALDQTERSPGFDPSVHARHDRNAKYRPRLRGSTTTAALRIVSVPFQQLVYFAHLESLFSTPNC
jgi:hypothetical protein